MSFSEPVFNKVQFAESSAISASPAVSLLSDALIATAQEIRGARTAPDTRQDAAKSSRWVLDQFLRSESLAECLLLWFGPDRIRQGLEQPSWIIEQIERDIATISAIVQSQLNEVLHAEAFQRLESAWRGLEYLVNKREEYADSRIQIKVLSASWSELGQDFDRANEFDQPEIFRKVYEEGIGQAGAVPFSTLIADYYVRPRFDDLDVLRGLASVAAAAFAPLITNAHPSMFAVDRFSELTNNIDVRNMHSKMDFFAWQRFREIKDSRFVCLAMPRMLLRKSYQQYFDAGFPFNESTDHVDRYLWGGAAWGMGEVTMRAFAESGWFANIRGAQRGIDGGGLVTGPVHTSFSTEPFGNAHRSITDAIFGDEFERELSAAGFLPLCACKDMPFGAFFSASSTQKAKEYNELDATMSARLSTMLNYMLCVSRFAHYLKSIARDKIGSCGSPEELQEILRRWIIDYVSDDRDASPQTRLRKPLLEAQIRVVAIPGRAGEYESEFHLVPHHELDDMKVSIRLDTRLVAPRT